MNEQPVGDAHDGQDTITLVVTNMVKPEHDKDFRNRAQEMVRQVHENEPGTLLYVLTRLPSQSLAGVDVGEVFGHTYVWVERFGDEAALKAHMSAPYVGEFLSEAREWLIGPPQLLQLAQVAPR